ncbi:hypothetical protein ACUH9Y_05990 [Dermabacteraceae bacterium P13115]
MAEVFYDDDADLSLVQAAKVAIIGFGKVARQHALNLRDSGVAVKVALPEDSSHREDAADEGFKVTDPTDAAGWADLIALLVPGQEQVALCQGALREALRPGKTLLLTDAEELLTGALQLPEGVGSALICAEPDMRSEYAAGRGVPALVAGDDFDLVLSYAKALGVLRAGAVRGSVRDTAAASVFCERAVLQGVMARTVEAGFAVLTAAGYSPETAHLLLNRQLVTAAAKLAEGSAPAHGYGAQVLDDAALERLSGILAEIREGKVAPSQKQEEQDENGKQQAELRQKFALRGGR